jgi:hypothetical protein
MERPRFSAPWRRAQPKLRDSRVQTYALDWKFSVTVNGNIICSRNNSPFEIAALFLSIHSPIVHSVDQV